MTFLARQERFSLVSVDTGLSLGAMPLAFDEPYALCNTVQEQPQTFKKNDERAREEEIKAAATTSSYGALSIR